jgi:hypothetical protein
VVIFALSLLAFIGPWWFDRIYVPSEYPCSAPIIRLEGDFCGVPTAGTYIFVGLVLGLIDSLVKTLTGAIAITDSVTTVQQNLLVIFFTLLLVLPLFSKWLLILRGDKLRVQLFHIGAWGFAASVTVLWGIDLSRLRWRWELWGTWYFMLMAVIALTFETIILVIKRQEV